MVLEEQMERMLHNFHRRFDYLESLLKSSGYQDPEEFQQSAGPDSEFQQSARPAAGPDHIVVLVMDNWQSEIQQNNLRFIQTLDSIHRNIDAISLSNQKYQGWVDDLNGKQSMEKEDELEVSSGKNQLPAISEIPGERIEKKNEELTERSTVIETKLDGVESRVGTMESKLYLVGAKVESLEWQAKETLKALERHSLDSAQRLEAQERQFMQRLDRPERHCGQRFDAMKKLINGSDLQQNSGQGLRFGNINGMLQIQNNVGGSESNRASGSVPDSPVQGENTGSHANGHEQFQRDQMEISTHRFNQSRSVGDCVNWTTPDTSLQGGPAGGVMAVSIEMSLEGMEPPKLEKMVLTGENMTVIESVEDLTALVEEEESEVDIGFFYAARTECEQFTTV